MTSRTALGPRARRRLAAAAVAAAVVAVGATLYFTHSSGHTAAPAKEIYGTFGAFGVSDGSTHKQLLAKLGAPDAKRAGCWIYKIHGDTFHGMKLIQLPYVDAVEYCFYGNVVSDIEDHRTYPAAVIKRFGPQKPWSPPLTYGCGGKPCHAPQ